MTNEMQRQLVNVVLTKIKKNENRVFSIAKNRKENQDTLIALGLTDSNIEQIILELDATDCISSFEMDKSDFSGYVFEFGKVIKAQEIYIKFRVLFENDVCYISCISFHYPNYKLKYLFK
ncbi:MAG: hypothetical protein N3E50_05940 [Candidatus Goldbacteria bacterium]|nr:hypothetical protein [Candidatus Goldiibacteriota bacterium]